MPSGPGDSIRRAPVQAGCAGDSRTGDADPPNWRTTPPWPPRYFVRRSAWHVLDHAWEIEDRASR